MKQIRASTKNILTPIALISLAGGVIGSFYFMFKTAQNQSSVVLLGLFTFWVMSPYVGLLIATKISKSWAKDKRSSIYWLMIFISVSSFIAYSGVFIPAGTKPAFIFLVIPLTSWFIILIVFIIAKRIQKK